MKRLSLFLAALALSSGVFALPLGNPSEPALINYSAFLYDDLCWDNVTFRLGYYGDFVFNRQLEVDRRQTSDDLDRASVTTNAAYLAVNLWQYGDVFLTLGASKITLVGVSSAFLSPGTTLLTANTGSDFSWSIGGRGIVYEWCNTVIGLEGQYFQTSPHVNLINLPSSGTLPPQLFINPGAGIDLTYREWQIGCAASYEILYYNFAAVPYIGFKVSQASVQGNNVMLTLPSGLIVTLTNLRSSKYLGFATGLSLVFADCFDITVEGRWADEKGLYVNGQFRF